jgi:hypothetical protein
MMFAVLAKTVPADTAPYKNPGPFKPGLFASELIQEHYQDEDFRRLLGINLFEDVTWFNKEGFEAVLFYGTYFFTLESDTALGTGKALPWLERVNRIAETADVLAKAEKVSGYRLDELVNALSGGKKPVKNETDSKKDASAKKPAAKPSKTTKGKTKNDQEP